MLRGERRTWSATALAVLLVVCLGGTCRGLEDRTCLQRVKIDLGDIDGGHAQAEVRYDFSKASAESIRFVDLMLPENPGGITAIGFDDKEIDLKGLQATVEIPAARTVWLKIRPQMEGGGSCQKLVMNIPIPEEVVAEAVVDAGRIEVRMPANWSLVRAFPEGFRSRKGDDEVVVTCEGASFCSVVRMEFAEGRGGLLAGRRGMTVAGIVLALAVFSAIGFLMMRTVSRR